MVRGPPKWLPYGVAIHLHRLGWNVAPPSLACLSMRLKLFCLIRLGGVDIPTLWTRVREAHLDLQASLLPLSRDWLYQSSIAALHDLERQAVLGNIVVRRDGHLVMQARVRELVLSPKLRERMLLQWLSHDGLPLANGQMILQTWLAKRIAWNAEWNSHRCLMRLMGLLSKVARACSLRVANAVLRVVAKGILLTTKQESSCRPSRR